MNYRIFAPFLLLVILFVACTDNDPVNNNNTPDIIEEKTMDIGPDGGTIELSNGNKITIPAGFIAEERSITFKQLGEDPNFPGDNRLVFDVTKTYIDYEIEFILPKGLDESRIGLITYQPDDNVASVIGTFKDMSYDPETGILTYIPAYVKAKHSGPELAEDTDVRYLVEWSTEPEVVSQSEIIQMPYYEQPGNSCWATCAVMLTKAYTPYINREKEVEVTDYLKALSLGRDDGIGFWAFLHTLPQAFHNFTGAGVTTTGFFKQSSLESKLVEEIKKNHPVIISAPYPGISGKHAVMIVGYQKNVSDNSFKFYLHNPQNVLPEGPYTLHSLGEILADLSFMQAVQILYPTDDPHNSRALQTIGMPLGAAGSIKFKVPFKTTQYYIALDYDGQSGTGYSWIWNGKKMASIPDTATQLVMNLPMWNMDRSGSRSVDVTILINKKDYDSNPVYEKNETITLPEGNSTYNYMKTIDLKDFVESSGEKTYYCSITLRSGGEYLDAISFAVDIETPHILDGTWMWDINPYDDECGWFDYKDNNELMRFKVNGNSISWFDSDDEEIVLSLSMTGDDFILRKDYESGAYIEIDATLTDEDTIDGDAVFGLFKYDDDGNPTPCVSNVSFTATRVK